ncbi:MAG: ATP-binding protein [Candidatus Thorarchaeota archaeon]
MRHDEDIVIPENIHSTEDVSTPNDSFERIIGQDRAVTLVRSAVKQRRHVLLCGMPGVGKSLLAKAAAVLLPKPTEQIVLRHNPTHPNRPQVVLERLEGSQNEQQQPVVLDSVYLRPDNVPFDVAVKMGYRCARCGSLSLPSQNVCMECDTTKRCDWTIDETANTSYSGLFRTLELIDEPALAKVSQQESINGEAVLAEYERTQNDAVRVRYLHRNSEPDTSCESFLGHILVSRTSKRFVRVSGASPVELLGDVEHDPYGSAESLGTAPYLRVIPGAIHEAHEGILYLDEIAALGRYQKHLLTAMQDGTFPIAGRNPHSSGAAVRVDEVPCKFVLFGACNIEDLPRILSPLRSRIRGYGYEIMLDSWMKKTPETMRDIVRFVAQTVREDGRIPHLDRDAIFSILKVAESMALKLDGARNALTLRLRDLGGLIRVAGDLAVQEATDYTMPSHLERAESLARGIDLNNSSFVGQKGNISQSDYGDYFF